MDIQPFFCRLPDIWQKSKYRIFLLKILSFHQTLLTFLILIDTKYKNIFILFCTWCPKSAVHPRTLISCHTDMQTSKVVLSAAFCKKNSFDVKKKTNCHTGWVRISIRVWCSGFTTVCNVFYLSIHLSFLVILGKHELFLKQDAFFSYTLVSVPNLIK